MHYGALPKMKFDMLEPLIAKFGELLRERACSATSSGSSE